jgi:transposase
VATTVQRVAVGGFEVIPRRWAVERTFSWLGLSWRLSRGYERKVQISETFTRLP